MNYACKTCNAWGHPRAAEDSRRVKIYLPGVYREACAGCARALDHGNTHCQMPVTPLIVQKIIIILLEIHQ